MRIRNQICIAIALIGAFSILPGTASATPAPAPAWSITVVSYPTNFAPNAAGTKAQPPGYHLLATNLGAAPTTGPFTFTDVLPADLSPKEPSGQYGLHNSALSCEVTGQTVTCTGTEPLNPGEWAQANIPVKVAASAPEVVLNEASISGGGAATATASTETQITTALPEFDFLKGDAGFSTASVEADGSASTQAGSHPYQLSVDLGFPGYLAPTKALLASGGGIKDVEVELPPGVVVNPGATAQRCTETQLESFSCPDGSQIGLIGFTLGGTSIAATVRPLFNMVPAPGSPGEFGFEVLEGVYVHLQGSLRSDGIYRLVATSNDILAKVAIDGIQTILWGVPSDASHDMTRGRCLSAGFAGSCPVERENIAFLTQPSACSGPLTATARVASWIEPGVFSERQAQTSDLTGAPVGIDGCNKLEFKPTISAQPTTTHADSPSGLEFNLHQPQPLPPPVGQGTTEICAIGQWSAKPSAYAYQWLRNGTPIPGETSREHEVASEDLSTSLQCEITATNAAGLGHAVSAPLSIAPVPTPAPPLPAKPIISAEKVGADTLLTCDPGSWSGEPSFSYQWFKDGVLDPGQSANTLLVLAAEEPLTVQCEVSGENAGGKVVAFSSNRVSTPPPSAPMPNAVIAPDVFTSEAAIPLSPATLKDATVTLPAGVSLNPSAANGLASCSEQQIGYQPAEGKVFFSEAPQSCPNAAKIGSLEVSTPLLGDHKLPGAVYVAQPYQNPFGTLLGIYLAIEDEETGIVAKLAGKVTPDPQTGQLSATFTENPQLPLEDVDLHFFKGPRGVLKTPLTCGTYTTTSTLVPWSTPEGQNANPSDPFQTSLPAGSGTCPTSEASAPNAPAFTAGTTTPQAGAYSPFVLKLTRPDGSQQLTGIETTLPKGLTGKLAGIPYCSEAQIAVAKSREAPNQGALEQQSPSCPLATEVGTVNVGAGAGIAPFYVQGHAYLAGPYKGAPLSLVVITPAVAGPFDLGTVVVRTALNVNSETAQITAKSDPLPTIRQGIPLDVRSIALKMNRPDFVLNPTSCDPMAITGSALTLTGQSAALTSSFQVGGCSALKFAPKLALSLKGSTKRTGHPALKAVLTYPKGSYANIARAQVTLPHSAFLDTTHIKTICTRVQFAADQCPKGSIYGFARAFTPLLDKPVEGPVYLRSSSHELPDLVVALKGQIDVDLVGRVDTGKGNGIRNTFDAVPDAPVSKFVFEMKGGAKGLLVNSENICSKTQKAIADFTAQNGKVLNRTPVIDNGCKGKAKKQHKTKKSKPSKARR